MTATSRQCSWFGKLPCVGDFCSLNMPADLQEAIDLWLSNAMQQGQATHGNAWMDAYFQTPVYGFVWGPRVLPQLHNTAVIGVIMPSVDKAGRAFPFVLLQKPIEQSRNRLTFNSIALWFQKAHSLCAKALQEDWGLDKFESESESLPVLTGQVSNENFMVSGNAKSHWFRIEYNGEIKTALHCEGLPSNRDFDTLLGLVAAA
jgi:type VI secretion system protein ImpM